MPTKKELEIELINLKERHRYVQGCLVHMMWKHSYPEYHARLDELQTIFDGQFEIEPAFRMESKEKDGSDAVEIISLLVIKDGKYVPLPGFKEITNSTANITEADIAEAMEATANEAVL